MKQQLDKRILVRLDDETDRLITRLSNKKKCSRVEAVREAIKQVAEDDPLGKIADRLDEIERRVSVSTKATSSQIEALSKQFLDLMEGSKANTSAIVNVLKNILEKVK